LTAATAAATAATADAAPRATHRTDHAAAALLRCIPRRDLHRRGA
jgi:hypothetical protein